MDKKVKKIFSFYSLSFATLGVFLLLGFLLGYIFVVVVGGFVSC